MSLSIRRIGVTTDLLGESPVWDERQQCLCWIDSRRGSIHRMNASSGGVETFSVPAPVGSFALDDGGGVILALRHEFATYDFRTRCLTPGPPIGIDHPDVRLNDGKADPYGCFVAGTMHSDRAADEAPRGGLFRLDQAGRVELLATGIAVTNGPCWSPDGKTFYLADSARCLIWAYDYSADGPLANRRVFFNSEAMESGCDGATIDAEGHLWSVLVRIGKIARIAPDGTIIRVIDMPVRHPTSITFGGPQLDTLYVTSISRSHALMDDHPDAGGLFAIEGLGVRGRASHRFNPKRP